MVIISWKDTACKLTLCANSIKKCSEPASLVMTDTSSSKIDAQSGYQSRATHQSRFSMIPPPLVWLTSRSWQTFQFTTAWSAIMKVYVLNAMRGFTWGKIYVFESIICVKTIRQMANALIALRAINCQILCAPLTWSILQRIIVWGILKMRICVSNAKTGFSGTPEDCAYRYFPHAKLMKSPMEGVLPAIWAFSSPMASAKSFRPPSLFLFAGTIIQWTRESVASVCQGTTYNPTGAFQCRYRACNMMSSAGLAFLASVRLYCQKGTACNRKQPKFWPHTVKNTISLVCVLCAKNPTK